MISLSLLIWMLMTAMQLDLVTAQMNFQGEDCGEKAYTVQI